MTSEKLTGLEKRKFQNGKKNHGIQVLKNDIVLSTFWYYYYNRQFLISFYTATIGNKLATLVKKNIGQDLAVFKIEKDTTLPFLNAIDKVHMVNDYSY